MNQTKVRFNLDKLEEIKRGIGRTYRARVGVLGSDTDRDDGSGLTNAELGLIQIFGSVSRKIPPRDFLIMPIEMHKREIVASAASSAGRSAFDRGDYAKVIAIIGVTAETFVHQAFETAGFGQWAPNAPSTIAQKGSDAPLIDTSRLRRSISSEVVKAGSASSALASVAL